MALNNAGHRKPFSGKHEVLSKLNKELKRIEGKTKAGMRVAAQLIKVASQNRTPVDEGNLKGSAYVTKSVMVGKKIVVEVGHVADYAVPVHEVEKAVHPVGEYKYLENAIIEVKDRVLSIVQKRAKIK